MDTFIFYSLGLVLSTCVGVHLWARSYRPPLRLPSGPRLPSARVANLATSDKLEAKAQDVARRAPRAVARYGVRALGVGLIVAPWPLAFAKLIDCLRIPSGGRALRVRQRVRLPARALGTGWTSAPVTLLAPLAVAERDALGAHWLELARMEHASVPAFAQLSLQLAALGAPAHLLEGSHRAALDEVRHAQRCFAIASAITGVQHTAGPIQALAQGRLGAVDLTRLALESLVDGCLGEGIAAVAAQRSAACAGEPAVRATFAVIAVEEAGHAELAWQVLAWCLELGGASVHQAIARRLAALATEPAPACPAFAGVAPSVLQRFGVLTQATLDELTRSVKAQVHGRARALLAAAPGARVAA